MLMLSSLALTALKIRKSAAALQQATYLVSDAWHEAVLGTQQPQLGIVTEPS